MPEFPGAVIEGVPRFGKLFQEPAHLIHSSSSIPDWRIIFFIVPIRSQPSRRKFQKMSWSFCLTLPHGSCARSNFSVLRQIYNFQRSWQPSWPLSMAFDT
jgi:hypothetical protein